MKEAIYVNYKAIFKYPEHKETISYKEKGYFQHVNNTKIITFDSEQDHIEIHLSKQEVHLKNNHTTIRLVKDRKILNQYQSEYGVMELITKLILLEDGNTIKIKYQLFDYQSMISEVYILITTKALDS